MLATSTGLRPRRSAVGPAARVPSPPASSISESRWLPCDLEWPSETSQSGTNVISPNQATLRNAITPSSSASAPGRSSPATERAPLTGAKLPRNGTAASRSAATTRHGTASRRPPVSPNASTSGVVAVGPSAYPTLPPIEKRLIPLARRLPLAKAANFEPSGWYAATPKPETTTRRRTSQYDGEAAATAIPIPATATPVGSSQSAPRRSDQAPKSGWISEEDAAEASISAAASV